MENSPGADYPLKAVVLVGGEGTRLRPLTYSVPKPMVPVLNRPFLEHTVAYLKKHRVRDIVLAVNYLPGVIRGYFGDGSHLEVGLSYTVEDSPLGTAGAVKNAERHLDGTFAVLNGDIFTDIDLSDMLAFHRRNRAEVTIALTRVEDPSAFGVVETDSQGRVRRFVEKPGTDRVTSHWINAGIYILEPGVLQHVPVESFYMFENGLFPLLLEQGKPVYGYPFSGYWLDMGTVGKYLRLNCDLLLEIGCALVGGLSRGGVCCAEGVAIHPPAEVAGPVVIGSGSSIGPGVRITGPVVIGADCHIGEAAIIDRAVLWRGVSVDSHATLRGCVVGDNARVDDRNQVRGGFYLELSED